MSVRRCKKLSAATTLQTLRADLVASQCLALPSNRNQVAGDGRGAARLGSSVRHGRGARMCRAYHPAAPRRTDLH